jgi:hypothetical protein
VAVARHPGLRLLRAGARGTHCAAGRARRRGCSRGGRAPCRTDVATGT